MKNHHFNFQLTLTHISWIISTCDVLAGLLGLGLIKTHPACRVPVEVIGKILLTPHCRSKLLRVASSKMAAKEDLAELMRGVSIPEAWYISPEGWMQKPDFKRKEQTPGHQGKSGGFLSKFKKNNFQWRWWILDGHTLRYYRDQNSAK